MHRLPPQRPKPSVRYTERSHPLSGPNLRRVYACPPGDPGVEFTQTQRLIIADDIRLVRPTVRDDLDQRGGVVLNVYRRDPGVAVTWNAEGAVADFLNPEFFALGPRAVEEPTAYEATIERRGANESLHVKRRRERAVAFNWVILGLCPVICDAVQHGNALLNDDPYASLRARGKQVHRTFTPNAVVDCPLAATTRFRNRGSQIDHCIASLEKRNQRSAIEYVSPAEDNGMSRRVGPWNKGPAGKPGCA